MSDKPNLYSRNRQTGIGALLGKAKDSDSGSTFSMPSVIEGTLEFELRVVKASDIEKLCTLSVYNSRSYKNLTRAAVSDILPSIKLQKRNAIPAVGALVGDKIEVLAGGRRMYSVGLIPEAEFYILIAKDVSEQDKKFLANTSDTYNQPSILDVGYKVIEIQKMMKRADGSPYTLREIADMLDVSLGKAQESATFARYPDYLLAGFPGLRFVSYKWLRKMKAYSDRFDEHKSEIIETYSGDDELIEMQDAEKYSMNLQKRIEKIFKPIIQPSPKLQDWKDKSLPTGIKAAINGNDLTLKVSVDKVAPETLELIESLLK